MKFIHIIMGPVSLNSAVDALLALGQRVMLGWDPLESAEITAASDALLLNLSMPEPRRLEAMSLSQEAALKKGIPVVLDPVGVGSSALRMQAALQWLDAGVDLIKANASEVYCLDRGEPLSVGVDALHQVREVMTSARNLTKKASMVYLTGPRDHLFWAGGECSWEGPELTRNWCGTGCVLGSLLTLAMTAKQPRSALMEFGKRYREILAQSQNREEVSERIYDEKNLFYQSLARP